MSARVVCISRTVAAGDWRVVPMLVKRGASSGSGAVILRGVTIDERGTIGAGAVVTHDFPADATVAEVPAQMIAGTPE